MDYTSGFLFAGSFGLEKLTQRRQFLAWTLFPVTKQEIEDHFNSHHGSGKITEIKLMSGFGFIEYEDAMDAKDVVPAFRMSAMLLRFPNLLTARDSRFFNSLDL
ncbi:conserved hypothetical protein [Histoplasma capsulatum H143]|uniref:RRM domain-containing protein n=1 Tax=Ajellomyces capsulatus (strain H143) TaxID=544712 RepID=C6HRT9_AJECH|nr:conserved hypothetical protein [Histoplasma capsulatum H143]